MPIYEPSYTQVPNVVLDSLYLLSGAESKLILFVCRQTMGYHRTTHKMSVSYLMAGTGLSKQGVLNASESLIIREWLQREKSGDSFTYSLLVNSVDQSNQLTPQLVNSVDLSSQMIRPLLVNSVDTNKERSLKKDLKKEDQEGEGANAFPSPPSISFSVVEVLPPEMGTGSNQQSPARPVNQNEPDAPSSTSDGTKVPPAAKSSRKKKLTAAQVYARLRDRDCFEKAFVWYSQQCANVQPDSSGKTPDPGDKASAAEVWFEVIEQPCALPEFRKGCKAFDWSQPGIPHFCRFIAGSTKHPTPYWQSALERQDAVDSPSDFLPDALPAIPMTNANRKAQDFFSSGVAMLHNRQKQVSP